MGTAGRESGLRSILCSVTEWISAKAVVVSLVHQGVPQDAFPEVSRFRTELYACLTARGDALFESCDALLCTDGPVQALVDLALTPEHRRGHGALYGGLNQGRIDVTRLRRALASVPLPRTSRRGCGRTPTPALAGPFATPSAAEGRSTRWSRAGPTRSSPRWKPAAPHGRRWWTRSA
ncbi:hypothetical protein GCM10010260_53760 [Streptomyces filipinensis]|uniref:Transposase IS701-like DDE domain-containing protein n=1 Tax=Streptomyces filipinensis TaxID=66887 RepID=A0A918IEU7_9ACTN|nr:hypothetical protein GCM10010260_53760 [Streptomyces filipinensis]